MQREIWGEGQDSNLQDAPSGLPRLSMHLFIKALRRTRIPQLKGTFNQFRHPHHFGKIHAISLVVKRVRCDLVLPDRLEHHQKVVFYRFRAL